MFRKSAVALALLSIMAVSFRLYALGLGEIDMQSALNQPMKAAISLTSASGVDVSAVKVTLASREEHERLGLSRAKILSNFSFEIADDDRGRPVIYVSSTDPVREPYLEFLLEMVWENGRMVREYTVLVDPPATMMAAPVAPVAPVVQAPAPAPAIVEPVGQARTAPAPRPATSSFTPAPVEKKRADTYGPVRREEALWGIAERLRPDKQITIQQMMIALQRANPHAFEDNNINNLKVGVTLKIPDRNAILSTSQNQASAEAARQYNEWRDKRNAAKVAAKKPIVVTPVREAVAVAEPEVQLKLTPPEGDPVAGSAGSSGADDPGTETSGDENLSQQLTLASEEIVAGRAYANELESRVQDLESQIEKMQRLLELKNDELASMQNRSAGQAAEQALSVETPTSEIGMPAIEDEQLVEAAGDPEMVAVTEAGDVAEETESTADDVEGVEDGLATAGDPGATEPRGIVDRLMDNPVLAGLGVLVAMLLGGFLWGSTRQRSSQGIFDDELTLDKHLTDVSADASTSAGQATISDPGRFDEDVPAGMETSDFEAASDPITEADVYLAYGRVNQAEDVLQAALQDDPENIAIRAKLLHLYHADGNVEAFDKAASEFRQSVAEDDSQWKTIAALGYELSPGNELYRSAIPATGEEENTVDFDMDLSGLDDMSSRTAETADADDLGLNMEVETAETDVLPETIEFTLDDTDEDESQSEGLLASTDEVATKLDLARAYLDMEDPEGARSILQEVIEEGNEEQKSEAESLISKIA